jgi:hypothetical protein
MAKFLRIRCPICNSLPNERQLEKAVATGTRKVEIWEVHMGGKVVVPKEEGDYKKKGKGSAAGLMEYIEITGSSPDIVEKYKKLFSEMMVQFAIDNGLIEKK